MWAGKFGQRLVRSVAAGVDSVRKLDNLVKQSLRVVYGTSYKNMFHRYTQTGLKDKNAEAA